MKNTLAVSLIPLIALCYCCFVMGKLVERKQHKVTVAKPLELQPEEKEEMEPPVAVLDPEKDPTPAPPMMYATYMFTLQVGLTTPESSKAARERLRKLSGLLTSVSGIDDSTPVALYGVYKTDKDKVVSIELDL